MQKYNKFIVAGVGVTIAILIKHFGPANIWVQDVVLIATAFSVYGVKNGD